MQKPGRLFRSPTSSSETRSTSSRRPSDRASSCDTATTATCSYRDSWTVGNEIAQHAAVIDIPVEQGHIVLFSNNPLWRGETEGSYFFVFNTLINFDSLDAGRKLDAK